MGDWTGHSITGLKLISSPSAAGWLATLASPSLQGRQLGHVGISINLHTTFHDVISSPPPERSVIAGGVDVSVMLAQRVLAARSISGSRFGKTAF